MRYRDVREKLAFIFRNTDQASSSSPKGQGSVQSPSARLTVKGHGFSAHLCGPMRRSRWVPTEVSALIQGPRRSCPPCLGWNPLKKMTCAHEPFPPDAHPSPPASILCVYNTGVQPKGQHIFSPQSCHQTQGKGNTRQKQVWGSRNKVHTSTKKVFPWFEPQSSGLLGQP